MDLYKYIIVHVHSWDGGVLTLHVHTLYMYNYIYLHVHVCVARVEGYYHNIFYIFQMVPPHLILASKLHIQL